MMKKRVDVIIFWISCACLCLILVYGYGFLTAQFKIFPYYRISNTYSAYKAIVEKYTLSLAQLFFSKKHDKYPFLWFPTNESVTGVVIHRRSETSPGLTFFSDCSNTAYLIDMNGNVVHKWQKSFYDVWPQPEHVTPYLSPPCEDMIHWRKAHLFSDGSVIVIYEGAFSPYGIGIAKLDAQSNVIWKTAINAHHDLHVAPDGRIFVLTQEYVREHVKRPRIDDYLTILSSDGHVLKKISLLQAIQNSPYRALIPDDFHGDYLHTNSVELLTANYAEAFSFLDCGDIMFSHNGIGTITILDKKFFKPKLSDFL